jgi:group I intron endonuclease
MTGIYQILNKETGDSYIGSATNIKSRWKRHKRDLKNNKHHSIILQRAWNKYSSSNFSFIILEECNSSLLEERENYFLQSMFPKYNICKVAYSTIGREYTEETRAKHKKYAIENNVKPPESTWKNRQKSVIKLDYNTERELEEFISLSEACRAIGKTHKFASTISAVCNGKRNSAFKFKWKWAN